MTLTFAFDPVIAQWGPFQLGWHGIFTALAVMVALWLAGRLAIQRGIPSEVVYGIAGWSIAGGLIGARLFHVADHLSYYLENPLLIPAIWEGGIAVYGAFIGGLLGGGIAAWLSHLDPWPLLDIAAPSMLVGQAIGRHRLSVQRRRVGRRCDRLPVPSGDPLHESERSAFGEPERCPDLRLSPV